MPEQIFYPVKLLAKQTIAKDIVELRFEKPPVWEFAAGQFVQFQVPNGDTPVLRSYSISSHPEDRYLEFCTKILPDGKASKYFDAMQVGEIALVSIARGAFICRNDHHPVKIFIATGTGIAPILSMISHRLGKGDTLRLVFGVRGEDDVFWIKRFEAFKAKDAGFNYQLTLSQPSSLWQGLKGRVTDCLPIVETPANYYICGSVEMVKDVRAKLLASGVSTKCIHFEIF